MSTLPVQYTTGGLKVEIPTKVLREIENWLGFSLPGNLPRLTNDYKDCRFSDGQRRNKKDYALCRSGRGIKAYNWKNGVDKQKFFSLGDYSFKEAPKRKPQPVKLCEVEFKKLSQTIPPDHPYIKKKQIDISGLNIRHKGNDLYVPIFSPKGQIVSWQMISEGGGKWFKNGHTLPSGHHFPIGENIKEKVYVAEGVATGVSIFQITGQRVYVSFSKSNLDNVAKILLKKFPKKTIVMCLDNDGENTHKPQIEDQRLEIVFPEEKGDFNDCQSDEKEQNKLINGLKAIPEGAKKMKKLLSKLGYKVRLNLRSNAFEVWGLMREKKWQEITDEMRSYLFLHIKELDQKLKKYSFEDNLKTLCLINEEDPFKTWLEKRKWDKKERLTDFLSECFKITGEGNKALAEWAFKSILLAVVKRTFNPGEKHDEFIILKSEQGLGKSSLFYHLLPDKMLFTNSLSFSSQYKTMVELIQGVALCEVAELSGFKKTDIERMKNFITTQSDCVRLPYRRDANHYPRRTIFVGTTNDNTPLPDDITGMRRFCVVSLEKKISFSDIIKKVIKNRDQLWAEAVYLYKAGVSARLPENLWKVSADISEKYRGGDLVFEDKFRQMIAGKSEIILANVLKEMKDGTGDGQERRGGGWIQNMGKAYQSKAKEILLSLGYKESRPSRNGIRQRIWMNKNVEEQNTNDLHKQTYGEEREKEDLKVIHPHPFG